MYLPEELPDQEVLITVKTYPRPTPTHEEIVCTAGMLNDGKWIRLYPIPFRNLPFETQFSKFQWIKLNLKKNMSDFRVESYQPKMMYDERIHVIGKIDTQKGTWHERKRIVLQEVFESMDEIIQLSQSDNRSLATLKPTEVTNFSWEEEKDKQWDERYTNRLNQLKLFDTSSSKRSIVKKLPYKFFYHLRTKDNKNRKLMIQDWEIGALYWNCLASTEGNELEALELVKQKYYVDFAQTKDLYLFLGTIYKFQKFKAPNPFHIIGVFPPPQSAQLSLGI